MQRQFQEYLQETSFPSVRVVLLWRESLSLVHIKLLDGSDAKKNYHEPIRNVCLQGFYYYYSCDTILSNVYSCVLSSAAAQEHASAVAAAVIFTTMSIFLQNVLFYWKRLRMKICQDTEHHTFLFGIFEDVSPPVLSAPSFFFIKSMTTILNRYLNSESKNCSTLSLSFEHVPVLSL